MKKYVMAGLGILFFGAISAVRAEMEVKVKDNTANNGFSIKEETTGSTIARFRGDGKVGIGTANPSRKLTLDGSSYPLLSFSLNGIEKGYIGWHDSLNRYQISTPGNLSITAGNAGGEQPNVLFINNSGNVGIGTTDPTAKLEVQNSAKSDLFIFSKQPPAVGNTAELLFSTTNAISLLSNAPRIYSYEEVSGAPWKMGLRFDTYASLPGPGRTTALAITGDGNVGIGTTNPGTSLEIQRNGSTESGIWVGQSGSGRAGIWLDASNGDFVGGDYIGLYQTDDLKGHFFVGIDSNAQPLLLQERGGNVGIGTTNPSYKLDVNGTIRGDNVSPSDVRWKKNINTLENSLEKVNNLRGVSFEWKDKAKGAGTQVGLIAQEVEKVFPEVVSEDNEGYKSVAYDKLVGVLVESIKELKSENDALRQEIDSIKKFMGTCVQSVTVPASAQIR